MSSRTTGGSTASRRSRRTPRPGRSPRSSATRSCRSRPPRRASGSRRRTRPTPRRLRVRERLEARRDPLRLKEHLFWLMWHHFGRCELEQCVRTCDEGIALSAQLGSPPVQYSSIKGLALTDLGRFDEAWAAFQAEVADDAHPFGRCMRELGIAGWLESLGALDRAEAVAKQVLAEAERLSRDMDAKVHGGSARRRSPRDADPRARSSQPGSGGRPTRSAFIRRRCRKPRRRSHAATSRRRSPSPIRPLEGSGGPAVGQSTRGHPAHTDPREQRSGAACPGRARTLGRAARPRRRGASRGRGDGLSHASPGGSSPHVRVREMPAATRRVRATIAAPRARCSTTWRRASPIRSSARRSRPTPLSRR